MINGTTKLIMTKADVLDSFSPLNLCSAYNINGKETTVIPFQMSRLNIQPVYENFSGWNCDTTHCKSFADLPEEMKKYISFINKYVGVDVSYISNGPGREQIISL